MNGWGPDREVEKPKGKRAQRAILQAKAVKLAEKLDADAAALRHAMGHGSDVPDHLTEAAILLRAFSQR